MKNSEATLQAYADDKNLSPNEQLDELHTTLPLHELIGLFATEISEFIEYDSFEYAHSDRGVRLAQGSHSLHSCNYHIKDGGLDLGEITFTRDAPFKEEEMIIIERALGALSTHLTNAVESQSRLQGF